MLIWAVFTLGYLFGVFFALVVVLKKEEVDNVSYSTNFTRRHNFQSRNPWRNFYQLVKPNFPESAVLNPTVSTAVERENNASLKISPAS